MRPSLALGPLEAKEAGAAVVAPSPAPHILIPCAFCTCWTSCQAESHFLRQAEHVKLLGSETGREKWIEIQM